VPRPNDGAALGVLGGTFDPPHFGHLRLAEDAVEQLSLAGVVVIPAGNPPHRPAPGAPSRHRLEMVRRAVAGNPLLDVDEAEIIEPAPSFTVITLERLRVRVGPARALVLLLGADAYRGLPSWKRWRELFELAHIAVARRPGFALEPDELPDELACEHARRVSLDPRSALGAPAGAVCPFATVALDISASEIRARLARGASTRYLLPDSVLEYIGRHRLYRDER
jgi:nicotinate-nucleotide adenylyltransferase